MTDCVYCGYEGGEGYTGAPPDDWWHKPPQGVVGHGGITAEDRICDLCYATQANAADDDVADVIRSNNYVGNRILEELRRLQR